MVLKQETLFAFVFFSSVLYISLLMLLLVILFLLLKEIMLVQNETGCLHGEIFIWVLLQSEQNL